MRSTKSILAAAVGGLALCSAAYAGTVTGVVKDQDGNPISGVTIWNDLGSTTSAANGSFSIAMGTAAKNHKVYMEKAGYSMPSRYGPSTLGNGDATQDFVMHQLYVGGTIRDDFNGSGGIIGRTANDGTQPWAWSTAPGSDLSGWQVTGGNLVMTKTNDPTAGFVPVDPSNPDLDPNDWGNYDLTVRAKTGDSWFMLPSRVQASNLALHSGYGGGDLINVNPDGNLRHELDYNGQLGVGSIISTAGIDTTQFHTFRIQMIGYHEKVWVDGVLKSDIDTAAQPNSYGLELAYTGYTYGVSTFNPDPTTSVVIGGPVSMGTFATNAVVDYISFTPYTMTPTDVKLPEPTSLSLLGLGGLGLLARRRRA